jgi:hypothetical protein
MVNHRKGKIQNSKLFAKLKQNLILISKLNLISIKNEKNRRDLYLVVLNLWGFRVVIIMLLGVIVVGGGKTIHEGSDIGGGSCNGINGSSPCCVTVFFATAAAVAIDGFFFCHCFRFRFKAPLLR